MTTGQAGFAERGGWWVVGQGLITAAVMALGPLARGTGHPLLAAAGLSLLALAAVTGLAGVAALRRHLTPFPKPGRGTLLVREGIYGVVRHPLYVCNVCGFAAWALLWASVAAGAAGAAGALFFALKARREEAWLRERFPDYADYARRVKGFLPGVW